MKEVLKKALDTLLDVQDASGLNRKRDLLYSRESNDTLRNILYFVFNPYIKTGIGWSKLNKAYVQDDTWLDETCDIEDIFNYLKHNNTGRDTDCNYVKQFISIQDKRFEKILCEIFTKNLKLGASIATIHKVWPNLIPGFGVQLACKWQDNIDYLRGKEIFITEKLDGNRCFAHVNNNTATFYSRSGKEIGGLDDVSNELSRFVDGWYDGELIAKSFNETQSQTLKKGKKENLVFNVFDYVTETEVENQNGTHPYLTRRQNLEYMFQNTEDLNYVKLVRLINRCIFDEDYVISVLDEYTSNGSEGIMINLDVPYKFTRTCDLLKVKKMYTLDLKVIHIKEGSGLNTGKVGALVVDYKGFAVGVGSGLSQEQREQWWKHPEEIIGRVIEIKAFEESKDKQGNLSLRFPVFVRLREEGKCVSYD